MYTMRDFSLSFLLFYLAYCVAPPTKQQEAYNVYCINEHSNHKATRAFEKGWITDKTAKKIYHGGLGEAFQCWLIRFLISFQFYHFYDMLELELSCSYITIPSNAVAITESILRWIILFTFFSSLQLTMFLSKFTSQRFSSLSNRAVKW